MNQLICWHVQDSNGQPIEGARVDANVWVGLTDCAGNFLSMLSPGHYDLVISKAGYKDRSLPADIQDSGIINIGLESGSNQPSLDYEGAPSIDGKGFRVVGNRWQYISVTAFACFKNYLDGKDIIPFLTFARQLGNTLRISLTCVQMFQLDPRKVTRFFGSLQDFILIARGQGLNVEVTIFADRALFKDWYDSDTLSFYHQVIDSLTGLDNVFVELVNEVDQPENKLNVTMYPAPSLSLMASNGSNGMDADPIIGWSKKLNFHPARSTDWPRKLKSSREFQDIYNIPCVNDEINKPESYDYNISDASDAGYCSAILCSGLNLHANDLRMGLIPSDPRVINCLVATSKAARSINPEIQFGHYTRGGLSDCPMFHDDALATRTFAVINGDVADCIIIQPKAGNPRKAINGWNIVDNRDNYYHLIR